MKQVPVDETFFQGAISVERGDGWLQPWRLPHDRLDLFVSPENALVGRAACTSGVRLRLETDATAVRLDFAPIEEPREFGPRLLDATVDNAIAASVAAPQGSTSAVFEGLPDGLKTVELWLPPDTPMRVRGLGVPDGACCRAAADTRFRWVTYGSSLTHCVRANSSARTWPAIVARARDWHVTSLGYGGNCCLEPLVAAMIRDRPADFISLKVGINCMAGAHLSARTFPPAVLGLVQTIREKHPDIPIALISPMAFPPNETTPNAVGYTIRDMRRAVEEVGRRLTAHGDANLYVFSGLDIFNEAEIAEYTEDQCHPNGDGIELMARHFLDRIVPALPPGGQGHDA
ncbi:MAG: GDSL family lipase [Lentisphaerae bacterium]|nr:GDSL family lipase [Lentisphaerota bacterium]